MSLADLLRKRADLRLGGVRDEPDYIYHGGSVRLPPNVHSIVHDESQPEHVRGLHLARHLLTNHPADDEMAASGDLLGQNWHRDSYHASVDAHGMGGVAPGRTPYVLKAMAPHPDHVLSDDPRKGHPMWLHAGAPVHFTGLFWNSPHTGNEGQLHFPEPVTAKA